MHSAVLILPMALKDAGDQIGAAMGWGPVSYTIPLAAGDETDATHIGLRADVWPAFIDMIAAARQGVYPEALPEAVLRPVIEALIADFSPDPSAPEMPILWGSDHLNAVCAANGLTRLA
ncbi:hypothetical protein [Ancylobacter polymorphus]|uniref:Uncharacterized protein n=1 Tax=Ancylobacter polymorphus TaxID=223390 RepID=A0A9E7A6J5_9HYPH|nr:hypothetical protein [Ancylobacter polymorphus]UOK71719.1 hypothetical protein K9D25_03050 [Ancylobacter polymorphus]